MNWDSSYITEEPFDKYQHKMLYAMQISPKYPNLFKIGMTNCWLTRFASHREKWNQCNLVGYWSLQSQEGVSFIDKDIHRVLHDVYHIDHLPENKCPGDVAYSQELYIVDDLSIIEESLQYLFSHPSKYAHRVQAKNKAKKQILQKSQNDCDIHFDEDKGHRLSFYVDETYFRALQLHAEKNHVKIEDIAWSAIQEWDSAHYQETIAMMKNVSQNHSKKSDIEIIYMSVKECARKLGVSTKTIYKYIKSKELIAIKIGKGWKISSRDLDSYIKRCRNID